MATRNAYSPSTDLLSRSNIAGRGRHALLDVQSAALSLAAGRSDEVGVRSLEVGIGIGMELGAMDSEDGKSVEAGTGGELASEGALEGATEVGSGVGASKTSVTSVQPLKEVPTAFQAI